MTSASSSMGQMYFGSLVLSKLIQGHLSLLLLVCSCRKTYCIK